jgi:c-di-GMP-binding flagellar brake protein YcgR
MDSSISHQSDEALTGLVEDPAEAARLLVRLRHQRNLIVARAATSPIEHNTMLLQLDIGQRYLVLDALKPRPRSGPVERGTRIYARTHLDGAPLIFIAQVDSLIDNDDGDPQLVLDWPTRFSYYQRRQDFRVNVPATLVQHSVRLMVENGYYEGRLLDISASGIALMLIDAPDDFQQGTVMPCLLPLPDGDIKLDFEIRHIQPSREGLRVGGQLLLQTEQQRQTLLRAIMRIERWWLQQRQ